tara:strand:- start:356 stop:610 length:255 start_codon:yes stop_codon:yes gene_type:complete
MALTPIEIAELIKLRAIGWNQKEIADALGKSQQVIAYQLKKLRESSLAKGTDEVFNSALIGGLAGAAAGIGVFTLLELLKKKEE